MFTATQQSQLRSASGTNRLDRVINDLRLAHPEKFHTEGVANFGDGAVGEDKPETMAGRQFYDQPLNTGLYASYVRRYVKPEVAPHFGGRQSNPVDLEALRTLINSGMSQAQCADHFDVAVGTIRARIALITRLMPINNNSIGGRL